MNVVIRLDSLVAPRTGIGYYTEHLTRALLEQTKVSISGVFDGQRVDGAELQALLADPGETSALSAPGFVARLKPWLRSVPGAYPLRQYFRDRRSTRAAVGAEIYHEPNFVPFPFSGKTVLTIHDLSHLRHPEYHPPERVRFLERYLPVAVNSAAAIIADSRFTADEISEYFPNAENKVFPVHLGVEESLAQEEAETVRSVLSHYGLPFKSYILSIATLEPRKNLAGLVRAYRKLPSAIQAEMPLVLVGGAGWKNDELQALLKEQSTKGRVMLIGRVPRRDLASLLCGARLFAYPSFYEGFGLPIAEARACGTPILTTSYGAMAEVAGDQACLVHPDELPEGLHQALLTLPESVEPFRYCWQETARQTLTVYEAAGRAVGNES
ncbi:glycosyltransferase family 4 protein [Marinobacter sp.]|uniref:glycosyltransferase family 4 protein n=1 Tax=Marinobacter sp. TaxID=50741 RepID=UPI003A8ECDBD